MVTASPFDWTAEGATLSEKSFALGEVQLRPHEVTGYLVLTNMLIRNASSISSVVTAIMQKAIAGMRDHVMLNTGDGVAKPLSVIKSPCTIQVARNTASTVKYVDVVKMEASLLPDANQGAEYVANQALKEDIMSIVDTGNRIVFGNQDISAGRPQTLMGRKLTFTGRSPAKGATGDLLLADFGYYMYKQGYGPAISSSEHVQFLKNKTVVKIVMSMDGQSWVKAPLTLEDGETKVSPFVALKTK